MDGDPEVLLGVVGLELRGRDDLGHVCDGVDEVEGTEEKKRWERKHFGGC